MDKSDLDPALDTEGLFDDDYLYFFATRDPGSELSDAETDLIWRLLSLEAGMTVLDLACGHGRIANRLAARGAVVTGLDVTPRFLEVAREDAAERGVEVEYVQGDMRSLPWTGRYDRVVNWFTAFGYFDDADNRQVLASVARALKPGGRAAIELNNCPAIMRRYLPSTVVERDGNLMATATGSIPCPGATWSSGRSSGTVRCARRTSRYACSRTRNCATGCSRQASGRWPVTARTASR